MTHQSLRFLLCRGKQTFLGEGREDMMAELLIAAFLAGLVVGFFAGLMFREGRK